MNVSVHDKDGQTQIETNDRVIAYNPVNISKISATFGTYGDELCRTLFMATKTEQSTCGRIPFQTRYSSKSYWQDNLSEQHRGDQK